MRKVFLGFFLAVFLFACNNNKTEGDKPLIKDAADTKNLPQSEFADAKYTEWGKEMLKKFEDGDVEGWASMFADNAVYSFSAGDSLAGKKAIVDYWKNRRANVDSVKFSNDIWLPIKVNVPQKGPDAPGVWLINWYQVDAKYKTGKKLTFWVHTDFHFDQNNKIDRIVQYIDRAPIQAATAK
jgi:hypothetical protein